MLFVIFTYEREQMLNSLLVEFQNTDHEILIIDDGSKYLERIEAYCYNTESIQLATVKTFDHTGKKGFWQKWKFAFDHIKQTDNKYICFLPDDVCNLDLKAIENFTKQGWDNMNFAINLSNSGARYRWGKWSTGQPDFKIDGMLFQECGYVDGCFITNRHTLNGIEIDPVPASWFNRPDKSSGVGYQLSMKMREKRVKMMIPEYSYLFHGDHPSVMHPDHRKETPLISKLK